MARAPGPPAGTTRASASRSSSGLAARGLRVGTARKRAASGSSARQIGRDVLVAQDAEDDRRAVVAAEFLVPGVRETPGGGRVVRAVEDDAAVFETLEPPRPFDLRQPGAAGLFAGLDTGGAQGVERERRR